MLYPDMSISEVRIALTFLDSELSALDIKECFTDPEYKKLHEAVLLVQKINRCKWEKEHY